MRPGDGQLPVPVIVGFVQGGRLFVPIPLQAGRGVATSFRLRRKEAHTRRRRVLRAAFLAAFLALAAARASGLNRATALSQYGRDLWDSDSGLPQNSVDAILQTRDGYLWLGTQEGLVRFDGVRFRIFDSRNTPAMRDDWVLSFCETRDGTLWVGTAEGLLRGQRRALRRLAAGRPAGRAEWSDRSSRRATAPCGPLRTTESSRLEGHSARLFTEKDGLPGKVAFGVAEDSRGRIWAGTGNGLAVLREARFEPVRVYDEPGAQPVMALQPDPDGDLWVGTARGLVRLSVDGTSRVRGGGRFDELAGSGPVPRLAGSPLGRHGGGAVPPPGGAIRGSLAGKRGPLQQRHRFRLRGPGGESLDRNPRRRAQPFEGREDRQLHDAAGTAGRPRLDRLRRPRRNALGRHGGRRP